LRIFNTKVYGLRESIIASGYPMLTQTVDWDTLTQEEFTGLVAEGMKRVKRLGNAKSGSGHDAFLKGIVVQADFQSPQHFWLQWQRYHFQDIVSSQSKMHKLTKMEIKDNCTKYIDEFILNRLDELKQQYNRNPTYENFRILLDNSPIGLMLTARITTNYLQLKTEYNQRKAHKNEEWNTVFVNWCKGLPLFKELCLGE